MEMHDFISDRSTDKLVEAYVLSRSKIKILSRRSATRAIRTLSSRCMSSDEELEAMIELAADRHGVSVAPVRSGLKDNH